MNFKIIAASMAAIALLTTIGTANATTPAAPAASAPPTVADAAKAAADAKKVADEAAAKLVAAQQAEAAAKALEAQAQVIAAEAEKEAEAQAKVDKAVLVQTCVSSMLDSSDYFFGLSDRQKLARARHIKPGLTVKVYGVDYEFKKGDNPSKLCAEPPTDDIKAASYQVEVDRLTAIKTATVDAAAAKIAPIEAAKKILNAKYQAATAGSDDEAHFQAAINVLGNRTNAITDERDTVVAVLDAKIEAASARAPAAA